MCEHDPLVSVNNEKNCQVITSQDKIAVCEKTAGLRRLIVLELSVSCRKNLSVLRHAK